MEDKVVNLRVVPPVTAVSTEDGILQSIATFLREQGILDEWSEDDVELETAQSDEAKVGELSAVERQFYIIGQLLNEVIKDELIEVDASNTDKITAIMREKKVSMAEAAQIFSGDRENHMTDEQRWFLNQASVTMGNVLTLFEWSIRTRYNQWDRGIIVRRGYVAYAYG